MPDTNIPNEQVDRLATSSSDHSRRRLQGLKKAEPRGGMHPAPRRLRTFQARCPRSWVKVGKQEGSVTRQAPGPWEKTGDIGREVETQTEKWLNESEAGNA